MKVIAVIPARYKSSRYPGKPMVKICGREMILRVADIVEKVLPRDDIYIATEDQRIFNLGIKAGYNCIMTSDSALTGTDRISEAIINIEADIVINVQGDEPLLDPQDIIDVIGLKKKFMNHVINCTALLTDIEDPSDKKIPKVVFNDHLDLLYMSRSSIPGSKGEVFQGVEYWKQICIYAFTKNELKLFHQSRTKGRLELSEDIEILRFLELGIPVKMHKVKSGTVAVDYPEDIAVVENILLNLR